MDEYYNYCSKKINRLRKTCKLTQGRKKFEEKNVSIEDVNKNQVALQILLFTAERNWAHAINFKNINVAKKGTDS